MTRDEVGRFKEETSDLGPQTSDLNRGQSQGAGVRLYEGVDGVAVHPAAPWREAVGDDSTGTAYRAALAVTVEMTFDESRLGVEHTEAWEAIIVDLASPLDVAAAIEVDHDPRDFVEPDPTVPFLPTDALISQKSYVKKVASDVKRYLDRNETLDLMRNRPLALVSRPGESVDEFTGRCAAAASDHKNAETAAIAKKFETKLRSVRRDYEEAVAAANLATQAMEDRQKEDVFGFGFDLLTGRKPRRSRAGTRDRDRLRRAETKIEAKRNAYDDLNEDLEDAVEQIDDEWDTKATEIETVSIGLEADDIVVADVRVMWIRVREPDDDGRRT